MELASEVFREAVVRLFDAPLDIVATAHVFHDPLTAELKQRTDVERERVRTRRATACRGSSHSACSNRRHAGADRASLGVASSEFEPREAR